MPETRHMVNAGLAILAYMLAFKQSEASQSGAKMIYEFRTYDLKTRSVPEFEARAAAKIKEGRQSYSQLFGFWFTEVGPLNQVVHVWPYDDLEQRRKIRAQVAEKGIWPPDNAEFIRKMRSEIFLRLRL